MLAHQAGRHEDAIQLIGRAIGRCDSVAGYHNNLGLALQATGRIAEAITSYEKALALDPDFAQAHNNLGLAFGALGRFDDARARYEQALALCPGFADAASNLGIALQALGRLEEAEAAYRRALALAPGVADVHNNLGTVLRAQERSNEAAVSYERALALAPDHAQALINLAAVRHVEGRLDEAIAMLERGLAADPFNAEGHNDLGHARQRAGQTIDAMGSFLRAITVRPEFAEAHNNLGVTLRDLGQLDHAVASYQRALALEPTLAEAHSNLGVALRELGRPAEAAASYERALALKPALAEARSNLGTIFIDLGQFDAAEACYRRAIDDGLGEAEAHGNLGLALQNQSRPGEAEISYRRALALKPDPAREIALATLLPVVPESRDAMLAARGRLEEAVDALLAGEVRLAPFDTPPTTPVFYLAYHGLDDRPLQSKLAALYLKACPSLGWTAPGAGEPRPPHERLRVGFVSRYFSNHTIGKLTRGLIEGLSRERFEVVVFRARGEQDAMGAAIAAAADRFVALPPRLGDARQRIADEMLDVLVYPDIGMDAFTYFLAFARLAPVQCVSWGHPVTTGIPSLDYFVSSALIEPSGADAHYTERLHRLGRLPAYYHRPAPATAAEPAAARGRLGLDPAKRLYVCPQSLFKLHPDFDLLLAGILGRDPAGEIVLLEGLSSHWSTALRARFARTLPEAGRRVRFLPRLAFPDFLDLLRAADAVLDPVHWSGGNSTYEALALGVPVVTLPSEFMRGRVTAGAYQQVGLTECVARDPEHYADLAVGLAKERGWREEIAATIRAGHGELFEDQRAVREWEEFFERAAVSAGRS